jgi:uncharacterized membrane protein YphA (DoxX/SURF4 family)
MKLNTKQKETLWLSARIFIGIIFTYSGYSKLVEPIENFRGIISQYEVIPYGMVPLISLIAPWLEFIFGAFMLLGYAVRLSAFVLGSLSLGFVIILSSSHALLGSTPMSCGCFGEGGLIHLTVRQVFILDVLDIAIAFNLFSMRHHLWSLDAWLTKS